MSPFEIKFLKILDEMKLKDVSLLLAVSGGEDSMVLLAAMAKCAPRRNIRFHVTHCHHGPSKESEILDFRDRAALFVGEQARLRGVGFHQIQHSGAELKSESDFRRFRRRALEEACSVGRFAGILTAHHADDLFETRFQRMMRGVGQQGIQSIAPRSGSWIRPFLSTEKSEIKKYAAEFQVPFIEDPSNKQIKYLRNFLRARLFPLMENARRGSVRNFAMSLEQLVPKQDFETARWIEVQGISRAPFIALNHSDQRRVLAEYCLRQQIKGFTSGHIDEILKRLDTPRSEFTFKCAGRIWSVDTGHFRVES